MPKRLRAEEAASLSREKVPPDYVIIMDDIPIDSELAEKLHRASKVRPRESRPASRESSMKPRVRRLVLVTIEGYLPGTSWEFGESLVVGRGEGMDLPLDDASICRSHAELFPTANGWEIADLGSIHGTYLNGGRLSPGSWPLRRRDVIRIGTVTLLVTCCD